MKRVFINLCMCEKMLSWIFPKFVYAMGIRDVTGYQPVVLDWDRDEELCRFYDSYQTDFISIRELRKKNITGFVRSLFSVLNMFLFHGTGDELITYRYHGVPIGGIIYDKLIRFNEKTYQINRLQWKRDFPKIIGMVWMADTMEKFFAEHIGSYLLMDDFAFDEAIMTRLAILKDLKVLESSSLYAGEVPVTKEEILNDRCRFLWNKIHQIYEAEKPVGDRIYEEYVKEYFSKRLSEVTTKEVKVTREMLVKRLGLDPDKKNVFVLAACFSDITRGKMVYLFKDYYTFMEQTMIHTRHCNNVNWIVKAHPNYARVYHEENITKQLYDKYQNENLYYMPDEWARADLGELADVIITVLGTGGNEYACKGIPVVLTGSGVYSGYGFTVDPETHQEYYEIMERIEKLEPLDQEYRDIAKKLLYCNIKGNYQNIDSDDFTRMYMDNREKYFSKQYTMDEVNEMFLHELSTDYSSEDSLRETVWYKMGLQHAREGETR